MKPHVQKPHMQYERLLERFGNGELGRRDFLGQIGRMALGAGFVGSGVTALARLAAAAQTVRYDAYGGVSQGAFNKLVLQPFAAKTGTTVNQGSYGIPQELIAKIQADGINAYNLCNVSDQSTVLRFIRLGYGTELDESKIPRLKDLIPRAVEMYRRLGGGKLTAIPFGLSGGWISYNHQKVDRAEVESKGFNILMDPKFKGAITGQDNWMQRIWYAAVQSGQNPNAIANMAVVWDKIRESKGLVVKYWRSSAEQMMLFSSGSAVVGDSWFVPSFNLMKQGTQIATHPKTGSYVDFGSMMVLKSAPLDAVYEIADILLRPEVMIALAVEVGNVPLLDPNKHPVPEAVRRLPGFDPTGTLNGYQAFDPFYWTQNSDAWQREYIRVMARG
jgi:spermidine/putrescine transport system substrate-binding protein